MAAHTSPNLPLYSIKVKGPHETTNSDHRTQLQAQLASIPKDAKSLRIENDTPSDIEWDLLEAHFSDIQDLELHSGFNEEFNDRKLPLNWPLQRLLLADACAEVIQSPWVRKGRIGHLALLLTSGLRFEGPTSDELHRGYREAIARGEAKPEYITVEEDTPEEKQIELIFLPRLVQEHMNQKYSNPEEAQLDPDNLPPPEGSNLHTLEIVENDALDTLSRMALALPHLLDSLRSLTVRSTRGPDFSFTNEEIFRQTLIRLTNLKTLHLSVGEVFEDNDYLPTLHRYFPPNLATLIFRGPASLCRSEHWEDWLKSFESKEFLPELQNLGFVLDLHYEPRKDEDLNQSRESQAPEEELREAREACEKLYQIARERGLTIQRVHDEWAERTWLRQVDDRW